MSCLIFSILSYSVLSMYSTSYTTDMHTLSCISVYATLSPYLSEVVNRGVVMSSNLSWYSHNMSIFRKVYFYIYTLKFHRNALYRKLRLTLVVSLIFPLIIDYCCLFYHDLRAELNTKLQQLINSGIRFFFCLRRDIHISTYPRMLGYD